MNLSSLLKSMMAVVNICPSAAICQENPSGATGGAVPIPYAVTGVVHRVAIEGSAINILSICKGQSFLKGSQLIPLLGEGVRLEKSDSQGGTVVVQGGKLCLLTRDAAAFEVRLESAAYLAGDPLAVTVPVFPATSQQVIVTGLGEQQVVTINGEPPQRRSNGEATFLLPADGGAVRLQLEKTDDPKSPPQTSKWNLESQIVVKYAEGTMRYHANLFCHATGGSGLTADLKLPADAQGVEVTGEDLAGWKLQPKGPGGADRIVSLRWKTAEVQSRTVHLRYRMAQNPAATLWELLGPLGNSPTKANFAVATLEGIEFEATGLSGPVSAAQLPSGIRELAESGEYYTVAGSERMTMNAVVLQRVETVPATIPKATGKTTVDVSGSMAIEMQYTVAHRGAVRFPLEMPKGVTIRSCRINDGDAAPVMRESGVEFWLPAPVKDGVSTVGICFHLKGAALDPVSGKLMLELPKSDMFTDSLQWSLKLPDGYECSAFEGNVQADAAPVREAKGIAFKKELGQGDAPAVEVYYARQENNE